jgi:phosphate transport system substrate-binding protein
MKPFLALVLSLVVAGCGGSAAKEQKLVVTGSSTVAPLVQEIGKAFEKEHPGVKVDVQSGGSERGITDARSGEADLGMISRELKDEEKDLTPIGIAKDGICMILNEANPVEALTDDQIVAIYKGTVTNWNEVGGNDAPITVVNKDAGRSTLELFLKYFKLKDSDVQAPLKVIIGENEQGIKTVAGNPDAIGYVSIGTAEFDAGHGTPIKLLPMNGVAATVENVRAGKFPLSRQLTLVVKSAPEGLTKEFLEFAQSTEVNGIIKDQFFVPLEE